MRHLTTLFLLLCSLTGLSALDIPAGRLAFSHDGNQHDVDDIGALAMNGVLVWAAGVSDRVVHLNHSNHLGDNRDDREAEMVASAAGIVSRFAIKTNVVFNCQSQLSAAIANFKAAAEASSASNPLWYMCCGPMEVPYRCLAAVNPAYLQYIHCVSHSSWNEGHADTPEMTHRWSDMKADFPAVTFHDIVDQNSSDGDYDWNTPDSYWYWLRDSTYEPYRWVYSRDKVSNNFDPSDAGMTYWFLSGGPNGGDERAGWPEAKALLEGALSGDPGDPPTVDAGPNAIITLPTDTVSLNGTVADPDGDPLTTQWTKVSGPGTVTFGNAAAVDTTATFGAAGSYVLRLTVNDGTSSASDTVTITVEPEPVVDLRPADDPAGASAGIGWTEYYGTWSALPNFTALTANATGVTATIGVSVRSRDDSFGLVFAGYVAIPADGQWTFFTTSDDGSKLFIGTTLVVNNDGLHGAQERSGSIGLAAGLHAIRVEFFEKGGGEVLSASFQGPGQTKTAIPAASLFHVGGTIPVNTLPTADAGPDLAIVLPATAALDGTVGDADGDVLTVQWTKDSGPGVVSFGNATAVDTSAGFSVAGTYVLRLTVDDGTDSASDSVTLTVAPEPVAGDLPAPWVNEDIGTVAAAGSANYADGVFTVHGSGNDIWNSVDEFHFVHQPVTGDVTITARVQSLTNSNSWAKAGVMIRQSTANGSTHASCVQTVANGVSFQRRLVANENSSHTGLGGQPAPSWVRVERSGNTMTASTSEDGASWTVIGSLDLVMTGTVEVGLCVTSHNDGVICDAVFTDVSVVAGSQPVNQPPVVDAGVNQTTELPDATVILAGTASDPDGDPLTVSWSRLSGPGSVVFGDAGSLSTSATFDAAGIYELELAVGDGTVTVTDTVSVTVEPEPVFGTVVLAVNAGGPAYTAVDGTTYLPDTDAAAGVSGGKTYKTTAAIGLTEDDAIYQSERYGNATYAAPVPNGDYVLTLQFAEIYQTATGKRVFDATVEGSLVIDDLDLFAVTGGRYLAYDVVVPVTVTDGVLNISLITVKDNAKLSGFRLESVGVNN